MTHRIILTVLAISLAVTLGCGESGSDSDNEGTEQPDDPRDTDRDGGGSSGTTPTHDFCADIGDTFGMGAAIFGDPGTDWILSAAQAPSNVDWSYGYMYASGDPHRDLDGFEWIVNYRLDTALEAGAELPTVTFYRLLNVGEDHGYSGSEAQIVQQMLQDGAAVSDYMDDFIALLTVIDARDTRTFVHVEPDSFGFMMWAFDGFDGAAGNPDATAVEVAITGANHPELQGQNFSDDATGLGKALLYLRDTLAPSARMGWHASNFRVGTKPEVVTRFFADMGEWDAIVTEPPHMVSNGAAPWDLNEEDNRNNVNWLDTVSSDTTLPILIWQTYVSEAAPYLGSWTQYRDNLTTLAENGVVAVLWDPNGGTGACNYNCPEANDLVDFLGDYSASPLALPTGSICTR